MKLRTIEGVVRLAPRKVMESINSLPSDDNALIMHLGRLYFR